MRSMIMSFAVCLSLTGCFSTTAPVKREFPAAPPVLMEPAPDLKTLEGKEADLRRLLETSIENMGTYHELRERFLAWQKWYQEQKKIFDSVK